MDGVTLVESGASRVHFAFLKKLEGCKSAVRADELIVATVAEIRDTLHSKSIFSTSSTPTTQLVLLLHCLQLFPCSSPPVSTRPSIQFALVPALQLAATADTSKDLYVAYSVLAWVFADQNVNDRHQTSLLMLNTTRQHLESAFEERKSSRASSSRDERHSSGRGSAKVTMALRSIISGIPTGPDIFPALYSPISKLCLHSDPSIQSLALDALYTIYSYIDQDKGLAKALWEQTKRVFKGRGGSESSTSLPKAILRATSQALREGVVSSNEAFKLALDLAEQSESAGVVLSALRTCLRIISTDQSPQSEQIEAIRSFATKELLRRADDYSSLLAISLLLGRLAEIERPTRSEQMTQVWELVKSHLYARNANRKVLAIKSLKAFIPFAWHQADNDAELSLEEDDMARIMELLGDVDDNVRKETLSLVHTIDPTILEAHLEQLVTTSDAEAHSPSQRREYAGRAIEVTGMQLAFKSDEPSILKYATYVRRLLGEASQEPKVDDKAIALVLCQLRKTSANMRYSLFRAILDVAGRDTSHLSPSLVLLCASAACETDCRSDQISDTFQSLGALLKAVSEPAFVEALLISMIKVASSLDGPISSDVAQSVDKVCESTASSLIRHRAEQLKLILQGSSTLHKLPNASLLETMERLDRIATQRRASLAGPSHSLETTSLSLRDPRPLQYEAYTEPAAVSPPPASYSASNQPFTALPEPSKEADDRARRQRLKEEKSVQNSMHKSIARLTLGVEESEDEDDGTTSAQQERAEPLI